MSLFARIRAWLFGGPAAKALPAAPEPRLLGDGDGYTRIVLASGETIQDGVNRAKGAPPKGEFADIPLTYWTDWSLPKCRGAVNAFISGNFADASLLVESIQGDDRVQAALNGRLKNITKCEVGLEPVEGYEQVAEDLKVQLPKIFPQEIIELVETWAIFMGFALVELVWEVDTLTDTYVPQLKVWHPYFIFYRMDLRRYMVMTFEGLIEVDPEDPKWWLFTPYGSYRGWMRGAVRSVWAPWIIRQWGLRDWARANEQFGIPIKVLTVPAETDAVDKARVTAQVANLGNQTTLSLPQQGGSEGIGYKLELLETDPTAWKTFPGIIAQAEQSITLTIRGTNLTTSVEGGSYAAAESHRDEDSDYAHSDRNKFCASAQRVIDLWCLYNYGSRDLAPKLTLVSPETNKEDEAKVLKGIADAVSSLKTAGFNVDSTALADQFGVPLLPVVEGEDDDQPNTIELAPTDVAKVITVNEARKAKKLGPLLTPEGQEDPDGNLTIEAFTKKRESASVTTEIDPLAPKPLVPGPPKPVRKPAPDPDLRS